MKWLIAAMLSCVCLGGCHTVPVVSAPTSLVGKAAASVAEAGDQLVQPGKPAAQKAMWPFTVACLVLILGGAVAAWLLHTWIFLAIGIGVGLVPPVFLMFAPMLAVPVTVVACVLALCIVALALYKVWDLIDDDIWEDRKKHLSKEAPQ